MQRLAALLLGVSLAGTASAQATTTTGGALTACPDSGFYSQGKFVTDLCWSCFFPMKIFGIPVGFAQRGQTKLPTVTAAPICVCPGRFYGIPSPGISWGMWRPEHTIELVRKPWCSPILFGVSLGGDGMSAAQGIALAALRGGPATPKLGREPSTGFYNFHYLKFPVGAMVNMIASEVCSPRGDSDMDYLYFSEFDPTFSNEMLALYTHPEIRVFTSIYAHAACVADAIAATAVKPINSAFWCIGSWGMGYPFAAKMQLNSSIEQQFLLAARGTAAMHRRGIAKLTYGNQAVCHNQFWFVLPKQQYQFQNFWPWPERTNAEWLGASSFRWGEWRNMPVRAEERVIVSWEYNECCITAY